MTEIVEVDPVCAMEVDPLHAAAHSEFEDKVYYFCSQQCKQKFDLNPANYADAA